MKLFITLLIIFSFNFVNAQEFKSQKVFTPRKSDLSQCNDTVYKPGFRIRCMATVTTSSSPLYVVDGILVQDLNSLDPKTIDSVFVIKSNEATAIYGSDGRNGVIIINLKYKELAEVKISAPNQKRCAYPMYCRFGFVKETILSKDSLNLKPDTENTFSIYPNPVARGNDFTIEYKNKAQEEYKIQLADASGKIFYSKNVFLNKNNLTAKINAAQNFPAGICFASILNSEGKILQSSKLIIL